MELTLPSSDSTKKTSYQLLWMDRACRFTQVTADEIPFRDKLTFHQMIDDVAVRDIGIRHAQAVLIQAKREWPDHPTLRNVSLPS